MENTLHQSGQLISGKYRLARKLGEGAFGEVWLSEDLVQRNEVVVKLLHPQWSRVPSVVERFRREALASQRISHPSACRVFEYSVSEEGTPYITMEYLAGGTLKEELVRLGRMPLARVAQWMVPVSEAVDNAHQHGIVHRDLKPENIMMKKQGEAEVPVVLDFGIAKLLDADQKLTQTGSILGSPAYMSPEQCRGQTDIGPAADVYSLAIIVFELVTGAPPFQSKSFAEMAVKHAHDPPPLLTGATAELTVMVARCLAKAPAERPPVGELANALRKAASAPAATEAPQPQSHHRTDRVRAVVDSHSAPTMISTGGNKEVEEALRRLKAPAKTQAKPPLSPMILAGILVALVAAGVLIGWLLR